MFLREGGFFTVVSGVPYYDGSDPSIFLPDTIADAENGFSVGRIWQSPFRNIVYESGVPIDGTGLVEPPRQYSGVYIHGRLRTPSDPTFGHKMDFINGRVIFNSAQPLTTKVHADYSAKECRIGFESTFNQQFSEGYIESKFTTNPGTSAQLVYPSGVSQPFPAVFIEVANRDFTNYELGNRSLVIHDKVNLWIWALDDLQRDNIVDILTAQARKSLPIVDFNRAPLPLSGIFNTLSPEYTAYQVLLQNPIITTSLGTGRPIKYITFIDKVDCENLQATKEYERALVTYETVTYLNAPIGPLPTFLGPVTNIPAIGDTGLT